MVQKPVEPPKPDPIVGTYRIFYTDTREGAVELLRVYPDNTAALRSPEPRWKWTSGGGVYQFFYRESISKPWLAMFSVKRLSLEGEPDLVTTKFTKNYTTSGNFEAIKLAKNPDLLLDHYVIGTYGGSGYGDFYCVNIGRKQEVHQSWNGYAPFFKVSDSYFADSLEDCEADCRAIIVEQYGSVGDRTCPQDRRVNRQDFVGTYVIDRNTTVGWDSVAENA